MVVKPLSLYIATLQLQTQFQPLLTLQHSPVAKKSHHIFTKENLHSQHSKFGGPEVHAPPEHLHKSKAEQQRAPMYFARV
jgi:hypothetical protein